MPVVDFAGHQRKAIAFIYLFVIPAVMIGISVWARHDADLAIRHDHERIAQVRQLTMDGLEAHKAICALRQDLVQRVTSSKQFLREHPAGIPGVPLAVIESGIRNQEATVKALASLTCP
jgi:hypothetical protein